MSELMDRTIDAIQDVLILTPRSIAQSWLYEPELGDYVYRIDWTYDMGYKLKRRQRASGPHREFLWHKNAGAEVWVIQNGGSFLAAYTAEPVKFIDSHAQALVLIKQQVMLNISDADADLNKS